VRYIVLGAGAIGATIGGLLAEAGSDVVLVARGEHARVMSQDGLRLAMPDRVLTIRPPVVDDVAALTLRPDDVLITASKTQQTAELLDAAAALPGADQVVVMCAQNGVENERIALRRFPQVLGCCVMLPAVHLAPGRVDAQGVPQPGMLEVGPYPDAVTRPSEGVVDVVVADLCAAGFVATARDDVMRWKYAKLLRNTGNALTALLGAELDDEGRRIVRELDRKAHDEGARVLERAGIDYVPDDEWAAHRGDRVRVGTVEGRARGGGSSWQSVERGTGNIESDALNGEVVLLARLHRTVAPVNEVLQREANRLARRRGRPGEMTPAELVGRVTEWEARASERLGP
jgi:2-dehydropantoate 2-reductase